MFNSVYLLLSCKIRIFQTRQTGVKIMKHPILFTLLLAPALVITTNALADNGWGKRSGFGAFKGTGIASGSGMAKGHGTASGTGIVFYRGADGNIHHKAGTGTVSGRGIAIGTGTITGSARGFGRGTAAGHGKARRFRHR
jgi:hypothetical protein